MMPRVLAVVGTRPEAVKMAPVIRRLRRPGSGFDVRLLATGQHRDLLDQALQDFGLAPDADLDLMRPDQSLSALTVRAIEALSEAYASIRPDLVLAQGDTTTVLCAALASYYQRIPFAHVEAGLRTGLPYAPFPEEKNRVLVSHLAELHFAPTSEACGNLLREGIAPETITITGNTVIDAVRMIAASDPPLPLCPATPRFVLATVHRRESFGQPLREICAGLCEVVKTHRDMSLVVPVHPNPRVREVVQSVLSEQPRVHVIEPVGYPAFVALMKACSLIITDSGGVQEEAPEFGKSVLVLRDATERPEAVSAGSTRIIGTSREAIVSQVRELWESNGAAENAIQRRNPYGDGWAAERIARVLSARFGLDPVPIPDGMGEWPPPDASAGSRRQP
jgi:UDP-N-acetylglucosamine 2-epimerase (non-hydrolysing)